jgi:hypothetical protein
MISAAGLPKLESLILDRSYAASWQNSDWSFLQHVTALTELSWAVSADTIGDQNIQGMLDNISGLQGLRRYARSWPHSQ